jgi:metal-responsive CopG/Arc/MetJ family transcriptional regulator
MVVKINISISKEILDKLDAASRETNTSRSALLSQAATLLLAAKEEEKKRAGRLLAAERIIKIADEIGPWDGTAEILKWRSQH